MLRVRNSDYPRFERRFRSVSQLFYLVRVCNWQQRVCCEFICTSSSPLSIQIHLALGSNVHIIHAAGNADDAGPVFRLPDLRLVSTSGASKMEMKLETLQAAIGALGKRICKKARSSGATIDVDTEISWGATRLHLFAHHQLLPRYPGGILFFAKTLDRFHQVLEPKGRAKSISKNQIQSFYCIFLSDLIKSVIPRLHTNSYLSWCMQNTWVPHAEASPCRNGAAYLG